MQSSHLENSVQNTVRVRRTITIGSPLANEGPLTLAAEIFVPERLADPALVFFCVPGGAMSRRYYDLRVGEDDSYSFAAQMLRRSFIVVTLDHLGIGESSRPRDGHAISPELVVDSDAQAVGDILAELRAGSSECGLPPLPQLRAIGVGHSMGGVLTVLQQAAHRSYDAIALLGFGTRGLFDFLSPDEQQYANDPAGARANIVRLGRARYADPYPVVTSNPQSRAIFNGADRAAANALKAARDHLLPAPSLFSMIPGSCKPETAAIDVPVFLGIGDRDICGPTHEIPADFPSSREITLLLLEQTGHSHFLFPSRELLFERMAGWARSVLV